MSEISVLAKTWEFNRGRTLATLDEIAKLANPQELLGWRPSSGRAHIAWQLMHIAITEELFATTRLNGGAPSWPELVPRFKGGSTPDDQIPQLSQIRDCLRQSREHLLATVNTLSEDQLDVIPDAFKEKGWPLRVILQIIAWHEGHQQGQAHLTFNLWKAARA